MVLAGFAIMRSHLALSLALTVAAVQLGCATPVDSSEDGEAEARPLDCSQASLDRLGPLDVALAFDNSYSSREPSGIDVDADGTVGVHEHSVFSDPDDSWLGAEVQAARSLVRHCADLDARFSVVTFTELPFFADAGFTSRAVSNRDSRTHVAMTGDRDAVEAGLDEVIRLRSGGVEDFYAGMRRANQSLIEATDPERKRRGVVLFLSDTAGPILRRDGRVLHGKLTADMAMAVREARRHGIQIHSFGLAPDSDEWRELSLGLIGPMSGGTYHAVEDPQELYCNLVDALVELPEAREEVASDATEPAE